MEKAKPRPLSKESPYGGSKRAKCHVKYAQRMRRNPDWYERNAVAMVPPKVVTKQDLITDEVDKKD